jgi:hypothetical protein
LEPAIIAQEMAAALLASEEARRFLPEITGLINCPVLVGTGDALQIAGPGYHRDTGLFITGGELPPTIEFESAQKLIDELFADFRFQTPGDRSRAFAWLVTPALKIGGHLKGHVPANVAEADQSQAGKGYLQNLNATVYNETVGMVTQRNGGVGSLDESLSARLIAGRPFIQLDNLRGKLDSPHIEALLTAKGPFPVRLPYRGEVSIDPNRFLVMLTSNGVETTRDFANRACIVRSIRKQPDGYQFRRYAEGDLLDHVRANQSLYLGAVFAIVRLWIECGRPRTNECRHDFREWAQTLDSIVQNFLDQAPLMDGHQDAQERASNPDLTFLRNLALAVAAQGRLDDLLSASALCEIAESAEVKIPGVHEHDEENGKRMIGKIMGRLFKAGDTLTAEGFAVTRLEVETARRDGGGTYIAKNYWFERVSA